MAVIISRQEEAAIAICMNHIREAVHPIAVRHTAINRLAVLLRAVQVTLVQAVVTAINQILQTSHHIAVVLKKKHNHQQKSTYDSYDDGYDDIYMDGDYDCDRYDRDSDYADGVDDAMDELWRRLVMLTKFCGKETTMEELYFTIRSFQLRTNT